ncbi:hypothetical protein FB451DRAFT_301323 [Mycena latifolia]|nr:hypothetical protein FB451DRAFT_301323 [Mycena latifolia]
MDVEDKPTIPYLPLEITDHIIDLLASQPVKKLRGNLAACSLVCRDWNRRSRSHFFSDCRLLVRYRNTAAFGELLRSPHCTILPHVRRLTMENNGACIFDTIKEELKLLTGVESLKLSGSNWAVHGSAPRRGFMASLPTVVELDVDCETLGDFDHTLLVICAFPTLRRLTLPHIPMPLGCREHDSLFAPYPPYTPPAWIRPTEHLIRPAALSSLSISAPATIPILHWLNWTGSCRLTRLELDLPSETKSWNIPPLAQFLYIARASLEHLKLSSAAAELENIAHVLDLSNFKNLRTLCFDNLFQYAGLSLEGALVSIVRSLASRLLESVSFLFDDHKLFARIPWSEIDDFLSSSDFPNLQFVRFSMDGLHTATENASFIWAVKSAFLRIGALGLLQIHTPAGWRPQRQEPRLVHVDHLHAGSS